MKKQFIYLSPILLLIFVLSGISTTLLAQQKFEGYWEQQTTRVSTMPMQPPKVTESEKTFYKPRKFKIMNLTTGKTTIIRMDKELMWTVDNNNKTYTEVTFAQMQDAMQSTRSALKEEMKDMSPEEQKAMEQLMGKKLGPMFGEEATLDLSIERTGKQKTIMDYDCEQVILKLNTKPVMEMWLTDKYTMGTDFFELYQRMGLIKGKFNEEAKKVQGLPLASKVKIDIGMGKIESESLVTKLVATAVSNSEFEVLKDYTKKKMGMTFEE